MKRSIKLGKTSLSIIVLIVIIISFVLLFLTNIYNRDYYYIEYVNGNYYTYIDYDDIDKWITNDNLYIKNKKYKYNSKLTGKYSYNEEKVYLQIELSIKKLINNQSIIKIEKNDIKTTLYKALIKIIGGKK